MRGAKRAHHGQADAIIDGQGIFQRLPDILGQRRLGRPGQLFSNGTRPEQGFVWARNRSQRALLDVFMERSFVLIGFAYAGDAHKEITGLRPTWPGD